MSYTFLDATGTQQSAESSVVVGSAQRQVVAIGSVLQALPVSLSGSGNTSISGTVGASIIGAVPVTQSGPWSASLIGGDASIIAVPTGNQSVSGTVGSSVIGWVPIQPSNTSIITVLRDSSVIGVVTGSVVALQGTTPWASTNVGSIITVSQGSVITVSQSSSIIAVATGSVVAIPTGNQSVSGALFISGSVLLGSSNASVITTSQNSSIIAITAGSVVTVSQGSVITVWQTPSVVGTYFDDAAHAVGGTKGLFTLGVRHDSLASVTSATNDYSQFSVGPSGEAITANAPLTKWIRGTADLRVVQGASVTAITARGASIFTYVTSAQIANMGSASVLVTFAGGLGSILGYTIAPAGGGSNILYPNALKTGENSAFTASISGTASVLVSVQGFEASI